MSESSQGLGSLLNASPSARNRSIDIVVVDIEQNRVTSENASTSVLLQIRAQTIYVLVGHSTREHVQALDPNVMFALFLVL